MIDPSVEDRSGRAAPTGTPGTADTAGQEGDTFDELWRASVRRNADATFLLFHDDSGTSTWTYDGFDDVVSRVAAFLAGHGIRAGDAIHLVLRNSPAFVALWLAAARLGAWIVPVDPASSPRDVDRQLDRVQPGVAFCAHGRAEVYRQGASGHDVTVVELSETAGDLAPTSSLMVGGASAAPPGSEIRDVPRPQDRLAVMFTSGTTSEPKGVVLTQANYAHVARVMAQAAALEPRHRWFVTLPLFHANAQYYCFAPAIATGASVALAASFTASGWLRLAHRLRVSHASLFAAPIRMILARTPGDAPRVALEHVWFAQSLGSQHHADFGRLVGTLPRQLYGMTETIAIVTADTSEPPRSDVIGRPVVGRGVSLRDPVTGGETAVGVPGVVHVRGRRGIDLFAEYLDDPVTTDAAFDDGPDGLWFRTGDLATVDADGVLRFVGRVDDVVKVAGENVSLTEIEATLGQAPGVLEVAVLAEADPVRDHVPVAFVVPRDPAHPPDLAVLAAWSEKELSPAARPREWYVVEELPRTSVGKIRRSAIRSASRTPGPAAG